MSQERMGETVRLRFQGNLMELETEDDNTILLEDVQAISRNAVTIKYTGDSGLAKLLKVRVSLNAHEN